MNTAEHVREVAAAAAEQIGTSILRAGDEFILPFDGLYECSFSIVEDGESIDFSTPLCLAGRDRDSLFERALRLNLHGTATRGAAISLDPVRSLLVLRIRLGAASLDAEWLSHTLMDLIDTARTIRRELGDAGEDRSAVPHDFAASFAMMRA